MATEATKTVVLRLYRHTLRNARKFVTYNYRSYAYRHARHEYRKYSGVNDYKDIMNLIKKGKSELDSLNRQVIVDRLYSSTNTIHNTKEFTDFKDN
mmetsp:Transcript_105002/g.128204  ORF Transcript_105002/g.128204 Transcript_105002/m.128204 type:complete len:96 (-) Transcript_105002:23-310(-)